MSLNEPAGPKLDETRTGIFPQPAQLLVKGIVDHMKGRGLKTVAFRPTAIHAQEHLGPITRLGAPSTGLNPEVGVACVLGSAHHCLKFKIVELFARGQVQPFVPTVERWLRIRSTAF